MKVGSSKFLDNALKHYQVELKKKGSKNQSQGHDPKHDVKILTQDEWWEAFYLNPAYLRMLELDKKMERERIECMNRSIFGGINGYIAGKVGSVQE